MDMRTPGGKRLYSITDIQEIFRDNQQTQITQKAKICYARVSSEHQRDDLERQIANLRQYYPEYEIISDIGSGLNWKRRGFVALLERIHTEGIEEVVVTRKLVEWIFEKNGTRLMVLGTDVSAESSEVGELAEDLLSIVTVFVARHNGMRSAANLLCKSPHFISNVKEKTPGGKRLYSITDIQEIFRDNQQTQITQKAKICYARVSSEHQRDDLERQIANLRQYYPEYEIISDIGSGLNWKRRGFVALLERIHTEGIEEVVVTRKV
ncbi:hypothetical protein Glove_9g274 [Diversispora epigaea]|uniref:Resolvase/invertase-type recombinase catalytic domain-containing protein n=1 Tax=Diversispora epigaea TaxID=1348612 RepID=A0A397JVB3_9GLOM|nr:hypothetical protein Glove_9g274 [Diversispora epigaea]